MTKRYLSNTEVQGLLNQVVREMALAHYRPDAIVAPSRGGLTPGVMLSHYFGAPIYTMEVSHRDADVVNYISIEQALKSAWGHGDRVLMIDDINDTGQTLETIREAATHIPLAGDLKVAVLLEKYTSRREADFVGDHVREGREHEWIVFPWECWWR